MPSRWILNLMILWTLKLNRTFQLGRSKLGSKLLLILLLVCQLSKQVSLYLNKECNNKDPLFSLTCFDNNVLIIFLIADIVEESPMEVREDLERETYPLDADLFSFIDIWSSDSMPSKASESSHNRNFAHFDAAVAKFRRLAFD